MTAAQFNSDALDERIKLVWNSGEFLAMRQRHGCRVVLYHLEELFVEVWCLLESNAILIVRRFDKQGCL